MIVDTRLRSHRVHQSHERVGAPSVLSGPCRPKESHRAIAAGGRRLLESSQRGSLALVTLSNIWASAFCGAEWTGAEFRDKRAPWRDVLKWEPPLVVTLSGSNFTQLLPEQLCPQRKET